MNGSDKNKRTSSAACLWVCLVILIPLMSGLNRRWRIRVSRVSTKIRGKREHPWHVPFEIEKAFDRWPLTHTFDVGVEYSA